MLRLTGTLFSLHFLTLPMLLALAGEVFGAVPQKPRFNRDIRPLLSNNCFYCHGPDEKKREVGRRLDTREGALKESDGLRAVVPGKPDASELMVRVMTHDKDELMPPPESKKSPLTAEQIATLRRWIEQGAEYEEHWAFLPVSKAAPPAVKNAGWGRNAIDQFIGARLEMESIPPSPEADRATLIRRVSLDLLGLLPMPEEVQQFVADSAPDAYAKLVDRMLASPHYGERWGRHWLDQARYADSHGYSIDGEREQWPYRDWVIKAVNDDMPFDRFTIEQLAGDLLPGATKLQRIATGFHRNTLINEEGGSDKEQFRVEAVIDRVNTTGAVWLGLTVGCAQCHTHKFDPITQREFYELFAFFNQGEDVNNRGATLAVARGEVFGSPPPAPAPSPSELALLQTAWEEKERVRLEATTQLDPQTPREKFGKLKGAQALLAALRVLPVERDAAEKKAVAAAFEQAEPRARKQRPAGVADLMVMRDMAQPRANHLLTRGDFTRPDTKLGPLHPGGIAAIAPALPPKAGRTRLDLARWLVSPENPLTPRVTVNRVWMRYFGRGLVETEEDFGSQASAPTHPELLDWLAGEFIQRGWSMKALHRLIVTSATYRQSSRARPDLAEKDPRNLLLARQERLRVEAEIIRDAALGASGLLDRTIGGPSVRPPQPEGVYAFTQRAKKWTTDTGPQRYRRALYTFFYRSAPHPLFGTFDAPDFQTTCTRRPRSNTPLQALSLANDDAFLEIAGAFAQRLAKEAAGLDAQIRRAFLLALGREPSAQELAALRAYAAQEPEPQRLASLARVLLNMDNFITRE